MNLIWVSEVDFKTVQFTIFIQFYMFFTIFHDHFFRPVLSSLLFNRSCDGPVIFCFINSHFYLLNKYKHFGEEKKKYKHFELLNKYSRVRKLSCCVHTLGVNLTVHHTRDVDGWRQMLMKTSVRLLKKKV